MEKTQREFLLRRQLDAIRKELGQITVTATTPIPTTTGPSSRPRDLPEHVAQGRGARGRQAGAHQRAEPRDGWIRTWLDTVLEVPWGVESEDRLDIAEAAANPGRATTTGWRTSRTGSSSTSPCASCRPTAAWPIGGRGSGADPHLVGPPGVGKTSLGESMARALGASSCASSLGGVRDEAEIRGHRRTYVGALPGPDRPGAARGRHEEPGDHARRGRQDRRRLPRRPLGGAARGARPRAEPHLPRPLPRGRPRPLARCCSSPRPTCSRPSPAPLLDRMEIIRLDGYTEREKVAIAQDHLVAPQLARHGLRAREVTIDDERSATSIADYTREAGVRNLEREIATMLRKIATKRGRRRAPGAASRSTRTRCAGWLGRPQFFSESGRAHRRAGRGHRPGGHRVRAATSCSSRPRVSDGSAASHPHRASWATS